MNRSVDEIHRDLRNGTEFGLAVKNIRERAAKDGEGFLGGEDRKCGSLTHVEGADVVEPEDVVSVGMCEQDGVEALHADAKRLLAEIRRRVNDHVLAIARQKQGRTEPIVA